MDSSHGRDFFLTNYARNLIRLKAHQLRTRQDFRSSDPDDLQQELWLAVCERIERFDPAKASVDTFIDLVVNQALASLLRRRQRLKRDKGTFMQSLDEVLQAPAEDPAPLADFITQADLARRMGRHARDSEQDQVTAEALALAMSKMPEDLRDICRRLMEGTVNSVACELNVSRRAVRRACLAIREFLERAGLENP
jgi:RNA polymerase sigma-70 factor (ECF subfamily)